MGDERSMRARLGADVSDWRTTAIADTATNLDNQIGDGMEAMQEFREQIYVEGKYTPEQFRLLAKGADQLAGFCRRLAVLLEG